MKFPAMDDEIIGDVLREAARKIERGEPLAFGEFKGGHYLEGAVVVAVLRGLADGKTVGDILKRGRPRGRGSLEVMYTIERAAKRLGSYNAAYAEVAQKWRGSGPKPLRGDDLRRAITAVKKEHQRARAEPKGQM